MSDFFTPIDECEVPEVLAALEMAANVYRLTGDHVALPDDS